MENKNFWLQKKRSALIGGANFIPRDYSHLLWYWDLINNKEVGFLRMYGRLRSEVLASQGRVVTWTHGCNIYPGRKFRLNEEQSIEIERRWRGMVSKLSTKQIMLFDWLTQEPIDYNKTRQDVINTFNVLKSS